MGKARGTSSEPIVVEYVYEDRVYTNVNMNISIGGIALNQWRV